MSEADVQAEIVGYLSHHRCIVEVTSEVMPRKLSTSGIPDLLVWREWWAWLLPAVRLGLEVKGPTTRVRPMQERNRILGGIVIVKGVEEAADAVFGMDAALHPLWEGRYGPTPAEALLLSGEGSVGPFASPEGWEARRDRFLARKTLERSET